MTQEAQVVKWNCPCGNSYKFHGFTEAPQRTAAVGEDTRRAWVGLTDDEINKWTPEIHVVILAVEAKLKEKNT